MGGCSSCTWFLVKSCRILSYFELFLGTAADIFCNSHLLSRALTAATRRAFWRVAESELYTSAKPATANLTQTHSRERTSVQLKICIARPSAPEHTPPRSLHTVTLRRCNEEFSARTPASQATALHTLRAPGQGCCPEQTLRALLRCPLPAPARRRTGIHDGIAARTSGPWCASDSASLQFRCVTNFGWAAALP